METWHAHSTGRPVIAYTGGTPAHPWTVYVSRGRSTPTWESAVAAVRG